MMRRLFPIALWFIGVPLSLLAGLAIGSESVALADVVQALLHQDTASPVTTQIILDLRLPRVLLAFLVGGGLSICGVAMQALVRNPLAEPYILGISSGASTGAALFYLGLLPPLVSTAVTMPIAAFFGGLLAISLVYATAYTTRTLSVTRLLLSGVAVSSMMGAITSFVTLASPDPNKTRAVLFWLLGSLSNAYWGVLLVPALVTAGGFLVLMSIHRYLDAFLLGEEPAFSLGVPVESTKRLLIVLAALVAGTLVSVSGTIGFVGLIIPHAVRSFVGVPHRRVLPVSFAAGGIFLIWADIASRSTITATEIPVGILTAVCGVPFFLIILRRNQYRFG